MSQSICKVSSILCLVFSSVVPQSWAQDCIDPPAGLLSWWPGDGDADDVEGLNPGMLVGDATFAEGQVGEAFLLDGTDDFVDLGNDPSLHVSQGDFTVSAWVLFNDIVSHNPMDPKNDMSIVDKISLAGINKDGWRLLKQNNHQFWFCLGGGTGNQCWNPTFTVFSTTVATIGAWFHVAGVKSSDGLAIYVNGQLEDSRSPLPEFLDTNSANLRIGSNIVEACPLNGLVDEVVIWDQALTADDLQAIYEAGTAGFCKGPSVPVDSGTVYYSYGPDYYSMNPDGTGKNLVMVNLREWSEPSEKLHGGARWFLTALCLGGGDETYPDGRPRYEIFAVSTDGARVRLTNDPTLQPFDPEQPVGAPDFHGLRSSSLRWTLDDRKVSWAARRWGKDSRTGSDAVVEVGIYAVELAAEVSEAPLPAIPARVPVDVAAVEIERYGLAPDLLGHDWSPDGKLVVLATSAGLVLHDASTGQARALAPSGAFPRWSPDGRTVAFDHDGDCGGIDVIVPGEASPVPRTILSPAPVYLRCGALWSPTGSHLTFLSKKKEGSPGAAEGDDVGRATAAGQSAVLLTRDLKDSVRPMGWRGEGGGSAFRRGDADANGALNITDAVFTLSYLFQSGPAPGCLDAADADDDGALKITDAIYLLAGLFLGGPQPPAPTASCGADPTEDALDCASYAVCP